MKIWNFVVYIVRMVICAGNRYKIHRHNDGTYSLMDRAKGIVYESWNNTTRERKPYLFRSHHDGDPITKKEYLELLKNDRCACEFNTGHDIYVSNEDFDVIKEFMKRHPNYYIELYRPDSKYSSLCYYIFRNDCFDTYVLYHYSGVEGYRRHGCLRCGTCLSDLPKLHEKFDTWIIALDDRIEDPREKRLKEICNH